MPTYTRAHLAFVLSERVFVGMVSQALPISLPYPTAQPSVLRLQSLTEPSLGNGTEEADSEDCRRSDPSGSLLSFDCTEN